MKSTLLIVLPALASPFAVTKRTSWKNWQKTSSSLASSTDSNQDENDGLLLDGLDQEMSKVASDYSFSESDFLAAAKKRAQMRIESHNAGASDEEWHNIASEKRQQYGEIDDWENSVKEAGNSDSQILMFTESADDGDGEDGEGGEPKLLLF